MCGGIRPCWSVSTALPEDNSRAATGKTEASGAPGVALGAVRFLCAADNPFNTEIVTVLWVGGETRMHVVGELHGL